MKKSMLCAGLLALTGTSHFAFAATQPSSTTPAQTPVAAQENKNTPPPSGVIDCNYKIAAETTTIDPAVLKKWATKATTQSFDFDYKTIDQQLQNLKSCFTEQGWQSFNDALQKSGNLKAIKSEKLMVSSMVEGDISINPIKDNQWKVSLPLQVVYQNEKEKLSQPLTIDLIIGRKISGDLGIMQMIAMPRTASTAKPAATSPSTTPAATPPAPTGKEEPKPSK